MNPEQRGYNGWEELFLPEFKKDYFIKLKQYLSAQYRTKQILPSAGNILRAFDMVSPHELNAVILGQDPYPTPGHAVGLAFSVECSEPFPPSLINIFREVRNDVGVLRLKDGDLSPWAKQGVLLLNTVLTVQAKMPNSHRGLGWEIFTDAVIRYINLLDKPIVFMLWGNNAKSKMRYLNNPRHLVLTAPHPSPLSAYQGFFGCRHFSAANSFLEQNDRLPISW